MLCGEIDVTPIQINYASGTRKTLKEIAPEFFRRKRLHFFFFCGFFLAASKQRSGDLPPPAGEGETRRSCTSEFNYRLSSNVNITFN